MTGASEILRSQSYLPVGANVSFIYTLKTWKTLPFLKFSGVREKNIDSKWTIHRHTAIHMFSLYSNDSAWEYNPDFMFILKHIIKEDHLSLPDSRLHTFSSNIAATFFEL